MKFVYYYRTSDNVLHSGTILAPDREAAFRVLKRDGVKPAKLEEASGFFNKLFGKGKRWIAIVMLALLSAVVTHLWINASIAVDEANTLESIAPRHQIYGDPAVVAKFETWQGLLSVFGKEGAAYIELAAYAQPGKCVDLSGHTFSPEESRELLSIALTNQLDVTGEDSREIVELKQIVNGMIQEMREYVRDAGTVDVLDRYAKRLRDRTNEERRIYEFAKQSLLSESDVSVWERKNDALRRIGLPTIPLPEE